MATPTVTRATDLISTFGVDTHINYTDGQYRDLGATLADLKYLGIGRVRDAAPDATSDPYGQMHLSEAADAGLKFLFIASGDQDPAEVVTQLHDFVVKHPGSITSVDGPNEINNWPITYQGQSGEAGALAYQRQLFTLMNADPLLRDIPISGFTGSSVTDPWGDTNSIHPYPKEGDQPLDAIQRDLTDVLANNPDKPFYIAEVGYHTAKPGAEGWEGVDEATQAKLTLNIYMDGAKLGSDGTYVYQLLDAYDWSSQEGHFGLFNLDGTPKMAAVAIHNLTSILADQGTTAASFAVTDLAFSVEGLPSTGSIYETAKSDGSHQLIVWAEPDIWDQGADRPITVAGSHTTITFGGLHETVQVFDPLRGADAIETLHDVSSIDLGVTDHPLIVQVSADKQTLPAPGPIPTPTPVPTTPTPTAGQDTLVLKVSQDSWEGNAMYTVSVDGRQIGGTLTAHAEHDEGEVDTVTLHGDWTDGQHQVSVDFLNDAYAGTRDTDRNLYLESVSLNGSAAQQDHPESIYTGFQTSVSDHLFS